MQNYINGVGKEWDGQFDNVNDKKTNNGQIHGNPLDDSYQALPPLTRQRFFEHEILWRFYQYQQAKPNDKITQIDVSVNDFFNIKKMPEEFIQQKEYYLPEHFITQSKQSEIISVEKKRLLGDPKIPEIFRENPQKEIFSHPLKLTYLAYAEWLAAHLQLFSSKNSGMQVTQNLYNNLSQFSQIAEQMQNEVNHRAALNNVEQMFQNYHNPNDLIGVLSLIKLSELRVLRTAMERYYHLYEEGRITELLEKLTKNNMDDNSTVYGDACSNNSDLSDGSDLGHLGDAVD